MRSTGKVLAITGAVLQLGSVVGLIGSLIGMFSALRTMGAEGAGNAEALANDIGFALIATAIGLCIALIGLVFILLALFGAGYRAPWFFRFLAVLSSLWILSLSWGTLIGIILLIYLILNKEQFLKQPDTERLPEVGA